MTVEDPFRGGDSSGVHEQLRHVQQIYSAGYAFAAVRLDGSIVTWGAPAYGGDYSLAGEDLEARHERDLDCVQS